MFVLNIIGLRVLHVMRQQVLFRLKHDFFTLASRLATGKAIAQRVVFLTPWNLTQEPHFLGRFVFSNSFANQSEVTHELTSLGTGLPVTGLSW
jgi:hypothetical protein